MNDLTKFNEGLSMASVIIKASVELFSAVGPIFISAKVLNNPECIKLLKDSNFSFKSSLISWGFQSKTAENKELSSR